MIEHQKKLYIGEEHYKTLFLHKVGFERCFKSVRKVEAITSQKGKLDGKLSLYNDDEMFVSIKGNDYNWFLAKLTDEFKEWLNKQFLTFCGGLQLIQQQGKNKLLDKFLFLADESGIISSRWFDYKSKKEVEDFFKVKL